MEVLDRTPEDQRRQRDSHDLALHLMDSMLSSLSNFPSAATSSPPRHPHPSAAVSAYVHDNAYKHSYAELRKSPSSIAGRARGHTYTSSMSDYEAHVDEIASKYNAYHLRSRRNSNLNKYVVKPESTGKRKQSNASVRTAVTATRDSPLPHEASNSNSRGSDVKGSGSSSLDLGYGNSFPNATFRHAPSRAASFDHSYDKRVPRSSPQKSLGSTIPSVPLPVDYTSMDAAPTPTVPGGPRRAQEPISPARMPPTPRKAVTRRNSVKSSAGGKTVRKAKSSAPVDSGDIRDQAKQFVHATNNLRIVQAGGTPNMSAYAPSPNVGTLRKPYPNSSAQSSSGPKEKASGFFRRVFGSSKYSQTQQQEEAHRPPSPAAIRQVPSASTSNRPRTQSNQSQHQIQHQQQQHQQQQQQQISSQPQPQSRSSRPSTQDASTRDEQLPPMPALRKAHSSFFRRRKKSFTDTDPPPLPFVLSPSHQSYAQMKISPPQRSPSSQSLRGAMAQYWTEKATSPQQTFFDSREHQPPLDQQEEVGPHVLSSSSGREQQPDGERGEAASFTPQQQQQQQQEQADGIAWRPSNGEAGDRSSPGTEGPGQKSPNTRIQGTNTSQPSSADIMKAPVRLDLVEDDLGPQSFHADSSSDGTAGTQSDEAYRVQRQGITATPDLSSNAPPVRRTTDGERTPIGNAFNLVPDETRSPSLPWNSEGSSQQQDDEDCQFVVSSAVGNENGFVKSAQVNRIWLEPSFAEDRLAPAARLRLPHDASRVMDRSSPTRTNPSPTSQTDVFSSATSLPMMQVESRQLRQSQEWEETDAAKAILALDTDITLADRERARRIFEGDEEHVTKANAAAWLGQTMARNARARRAYMELYDWHGVNILAAFRDLCGRLVVKAESQQLDRVIDAFAERWCNTNPNHGFKDRDVVHTITFSLLMLNTDLHIADLDQRMTRSQFVKNTLPTIRSIADASAPDATETIRARVKQTRMGIPWDHASSPASPQLPPSNPQKEERRSLDVKRPNRLSMRPLALRSESDGASDSTDNCNVLVKSPYDGNMKGWEVQVEIVLKDFYTSIRNQRLPLHGAVTNQVHLQPSQSGLSVMASALRRTPSVLSKAPSETASYRGRTSDGNGVRSTSSRFGSKTRSRPRMYPSSTLGSSRTSLDDQSVWSPSGSTWSKYSLGKTHPSMSVGSLGSHFDPRDYRRAIGFANALSQAAIRDDAFGNVSGNEYTGRAVPLLEDETLELAGSPWAKEGMVKHKHHLETLEKKAKERNWNDCFAVIDKGYMRLFSFNADSKSTRQRAKSRAASSATGGGVVGGGNWTENAKELSAFLLRQTIASALPPPGYSKSRTHVFALSLPTGAVHLFQVGTPDIVKEFVSTANYWSARLSKEPLVGGVSNVEYGWSDNILNTASLQRQHPAAQNNTGPPETGSSTNSHAVAFHSGRERHGSVASATQSLSSGKVTVGGRSEDQAVPVSSLKLRLPGDKALISDWKPPVQSMMASQLMEIDQLRALTTYVANVEAELQKHNDLRSLMGMAFSPRHPNAAKAMNNWEKKSAYLLREIVKFRTYIDSLNAAQAVKEEIQKGRDAAGTPGETENPEASSSSVSVADTVRDNSVQSWHIENNDG